MRLSELQLQKSFQSINSHATLQQLQAEKCEALQSALAKNENFLIALDSISSSLPIEFTSQLLVLRKEHTSRLVTLQEFYRELPQENALISAEIASAKQHCRQY